ncbi:3-hydroxy-3-methylglutaryl-CoA reductase, partial [Xylella fastidiosa subsp. multiplex]|nr:3-hydroxy-3-methylglutaryl-CoA reductase [Xylella fastidiosa subsp. multiplex]
NKGIMNGIDPVIVATGNDWRAVEAGAHAYACRDGRYTSLTHWEKDASGALVGTLEMPMPVGLVGGATKTHPLARVA